MNRYPHIFQPLRIKSMYLKNRIGIPPLATNFAALDGTVRDEHIKYYLRRAKGGAGLIIVENVCVDYPLGTNGTTQLRLDDDQYIPGIYTLVEKIKSYGTAVSVQLNHAGSGAYTGRLNGADMVSSSAVPAKQGMKIPRSLSIAEMENIADKFGQAARRARQAGFDGVEIHAGHAYLLNQFISSLYNRRDDEFGGSYENRARFPKMVTKAVRAAVGPDFVVGMRVSADERYADGNSLDDTMKILEYFADDIDVFNVSAGIMESIWFTMDMADLPDGWRVYMAEEVRKRFGKPVMTSGNIRKPEMAEKILAEGKADIILIGRGHIADPDWTNKTLEGREDSIRPCISCNIGCCGNRMGGARPIRCAVNPDVVEAAMPEHVDNPLRIVVIGAGVAGLEAACTAAEMGCSVILYEKEKSMGGLAGKLALMKHKKRIGRFTAWLERRARALPKLDIRLNSKFETGDLDIIKPDMVILATGAKPSLPSIPGLKEALEHGNAATAIDLIDNREKYKSLSGKRVVIAGAGAVGLDVAEWCVDAGADTITIVEKLPQAGTGLDLITRSAFLDMIKTNNITLLLNSEILSVSNNSFKLKTVDGEMDAPFDIAFICLGMSPLKDCQTELENWCLKNRRGFLLVGDARAGRKIIDGIAEGRNIKNAIAAISSRAL